MRILMVAPSLPYPQVSGGRIRIYNLLRQVACRHEVSLAALLESPRDVEGLPHLQQFCASVETANFPAHERKRLAKAAGMIRYAVKGNPPELALLHSDELVEKIERLFARIPFDIVQIESVMALYLPHLPQTRAYKTLQMFQNVAAHQLVRISHIERRPERRVRTWLNAAFMKQWEPRYAGHFDRCTTVSAVDQQLLLKANPRLQVDVIPNGVDTERYQPLPAPMENAAPRLMFIGHMGYPPCVDGVIYFCRDILPLIRQAVNRVELRIVGANPHPDVLKLHGNGVHVTGRVEDVVPYYHDSTITVVPLRAGGGTRLKILEAMALGRPVVSTSIGCEGLDVVHGEHLLIADNPEEFAKNTVRLLHDRNLVRHLCANARRLVEVRYSWGTIGAQLMDVYEKMAAPLLVENGGRSSSLAV
jgi:sugar transferase (PEP-CTERM/EpsH1 system associated)